MANLKVVVPLLNKRLFPVVNTADKSNVVGQVMKDSRFESIAEITNASGNWYQDRDGYYYWGGGVSKLQPENNTSLQPDIYPNWMLNLNIPQIWAYSTGKNVGVAIIDTGIDELNSQLPYNKSNYYIFDKNASLQDSNGHGTHCAGLIGARNEQGKIVGAAPDCNLFVCKISEKGSLKASELFRYADAINWCANQEEIHLISISWGSFINDQTIVSDIQAAVNNAIAKNKVVLCAIGDASQFNDPGPLYPASVDNTIGIGSIPVENVLYPYINRSLTTLIEGINIASYGLNNQSIELSGTSQSNAIIAGIIALIIEKKNMNYTPSEIKDTLLGVSVFQNFKGINIPVVNGDLLLKYFQM